MPLWSCTRNWTESGSLVLPVENHLKPQTPHLPRGRSHMQRLGLTKSQFGPLRLVSVVFVLICTNCSQLLHLFTALICCVAKKFVHTDSALGLMQHSATRSPMHSTQSRASSNPAKPSRQRVARCALSWQLTWSCQHETSSTSYPLVI